MPTWTKKDYEAVAEVLHTTEMTEDERIYLSHDFGMLFLEDNPLFNYTRFRAVIARGELIRRSGKRPRWTTRTFRVIANILKTGKDSGWLSEETHARLVRQFAEKSSQVNPNFDYSRFERAAYRHPEVRVHRYRRKS